MQLFSWFACGSQNHDLFVTQGDYRIDARGAARWQETRKQSEKTQPDYSGNKHPRVGWFQPKKYGSGCLGDGRAQNRAED